MRRLTKKLLIESLMRQFSKIDRNNRKKMVASRGQFQLAAWDSGDIVYAPWVDPQKKKISQKVLRTQKGGRIGSKWGQFDNFQESSKSQCVFATANLVDVFIICWPTKKSLKKPYLKSHKKSTIWFRSNSIWPFSLILENGCYRFCPIATKFFYPIDSTGFFKC